MSSTTELADRARFMRNAAPQAYADFVAAFTRYSTQTIQNLIGTTGNLSLAQGHAQQCAKILKVLEDAKNG